jgi:hypothetical protein
MRQPGVSAIWSSSRREAVRLYELSDAAFEQQWDVDLSRLGIRHDTFRQTASILRRISITVHPISKKPLPSEIEYVVQDHKILWPER